jgi:alkaline phosphatase D
MRLAPSRLLLLVSALFLTGSVGAQQSVFKIAFGSCSRQTSKDHLWNEILQKNPNLWMWIGDNVYADTHNMDSLRRDYAVQKSHPDYQRLIKLAPIIGTWDDHDYGANDGGKFYSRKEQSKEELLRFLDVPADAEVRKHGGVYQSFIYGKGKKRVKVILLDTRYFRDTLERSEEKGKRYKLNQDGDVLGETQWTWLEKELSNSNASIHVIASSIQFLANEHGFEKWGNFPKARQRMFDLLQKIKPANTLFVSGDRHIAEFSKIKLPDLNYPLYDFTSSGLTHTWSEAWDEKNELRVGKIIIEKNYGLISIEWKKKKAVVTLQVLGKDNKVFAQERIDFQSGR